MIASILSKDDEIRRIFTPSYRIDDYGNYQPTLAKEWNIVCNELHTLSDSLIVTEAEANEIYSFWRQESTKILPPSTFVWLDELESAWHAAYSEKCMDVDKRPGGHELNFSPIISPNVVSFIYAGFEKLLICPASSSNEYLSGIISFDKLLHILNLDPYYGVESIATESILRDIYRENIGNELFKQFSRNYSLLPCKTDKQRHLICLWCGLMGLPAYRGDQPLGWQQEEFLDHWTEDFDVRLNEVREFMRAHSWSLPTLLFSGEVDNTERKFALSIEDYDAAYHNHVVLLPPLKDELKEVLNIKPISMEDRRDKQAEISRIKQEIETIENGSPELTKPDKSVESVRTASLRHDSYDNDGPISTDTDLAIDKEVYLPPQKFKPMAKNADDWCRVIHEWHSNNPDMTRGDSWAAFRKGQLIAGFTITKHLSGINLDCENPLSKKDFKRRWDGYLQKIPT